MSCTLSPTIPESASALEAEICRHLKFSMGREAETASVHDLFWAVSLTVRDLLMEQRLETERRFREAGVKRLYYLSMEFLLGRSLGSNLANIGRYDLFAEAVSRLGHDLGAVCESEPDAALGNGGLGRLAACFLDSLATLGYPGFGYGINYEFGLFKQLFENGYQKEMPDRWLAMGTPWEVGRPEERCLVPVFGRIEHARDRDGRYNPMWMDWSLLVGVPHDMLIPGYGGKTVNYLRLYTARASNEFDIGIFNQGDYYRAVEQKITSERVSKILYPSDTVREGKELRLIQEYFFTACAVRDIVNRYQGEHEGFNRFPDRVAVQLNDTHPALAVAELMRILVDENLVPWDRAWETTRQTLSFTNHTLLHEALERWPVDLLEHVLPRHLQIIYEINHRFLKAVSVVWPNDLDRSRRMSIIEEGEVRQVRMAHLAMCGCHSINGVARLHTELIKRELAADFHDLWPGKFNNKTNGITQRLWLLKANPGLAGLITEQIGEGWITDCERLGDLEPLASDASFRKRFRQVKRSNKERLARTIRQTAMVRLDPDSLFDIHAKRIHEYKRQLLNVLQIIHRYLGIVEDGEAPSVPRTFVFAGKAAPGYGVAKGIIKLINSVAKVINADQQVGGALKVVFIPDYRVSLAEKIIPAADLSEQISTAGKEASGTGNMKFALNGALTMGTLDGANIEIREAVGEENVFLFGLTAEEIREIAGGEGYDPRGWFYDDHRIRRVLDALVSDRFCPEEPGLFRWIHEYLLNPGDIYFHLADLGAYIDAQEGVDRLYRDPEEWFRKAILNVAKMGPFSSDRTIREYAREIWRIEPQI